MRPIPFRTIYFKIIVEKYNPPAELSIEQIRKIPCHEIYFNELEEKFFEIRFKPQPDVTDDMVLQEHLYALRKKFKIRGHEIYEVRNTGLTG
ncbi:MAG: hypothetical protein ACI85I_000291 [Arenicella sp.]|jgi:hypothetical protein